MNPDGISYLDMAGQALRTGPLALVNGYWSPLYPALIALWEYIFRPSPFQEFASIHALNAVIYACTAVSFAYFLRELMRLRSIAGRHATQRAVLVTFAFAVFFHFMNTDITSFVNTPDLLVAIALFIAAGLSFRILQNGGSRSIFIGLGVVLGLGYLAKAAMLPIGLMLFCILLLHSPRSKPRWKHIGMAAGLMFLLSAPQILLVSKRVGHFSISETGTLNYLWFVDGLRVSSGWGTPRGQVAEHGPKVIEKNPTLIEFASPIPGTYPLWYDPAYWYDGAKARFDWKGELHAIANTLRFYRAIFGDLRLPLEGLTMLAILAYVERKRPERTELVFLLWPVAVLSMYALVYTEYRYIAPILVILFLVAYSSILGRVDRVKSILLAALAGVMLLWSVHETVIPYRRTPETSQADLKFVSYWVAPPSAVSADQIAARRLSSLGLKARDRIATVGDAFNDYFAYILRLHVVAEIEDDTNFWELPKKVAFAAEQRLADTGAKLLVAKNRPKGFQPGLWQDIPGTPYSVLTLRN